MAEEWVNAIELLKDKEHRKWLEHSYVGYSPDEGSIIFPDKETGVEEYANYCRNGRFLTVGSRGFTYGRPKEKESGQQVAKSEYNNSGCHLTLSAKKELIVVAHDATEFKLFLYGGYGYSHALELFQSYANKCFRNSKLKAKPMCFNKELAEGLSKWLKTTPERAYWLADQSEFKYYSHLVHYLLGMSTKGEVFEIRLYDSESFPQYGELSVRFAAYLPSTTVINVGSRIWDGSTPIRPLQIKLGKASDDAKLQGPQVNLQNEDDIEKALKELSNMKRKMEQQIKEIDLLAKRLEKFSKQ